MTTLRIIGDVHNLQSQYIDLVKDCDYSVQLGDFSFTYDKLLESNVDPAKHKIIQGNHDNYDQWIIEKVPHLLTSFGEVQLGPFNFFYYRGAWSIDKVWRQQHYQKYGVKSWWVEEELNEEDSVEGIMQYCEMKPKLVLTHDCPTFVSDKVGSPYVLRSFGWPMNFISPTQEALQSMYDEWKPDQWIFGHYHKSWMYNDLHTKFRCLDELHHIDIKVE